MYTSRRHFISLTKLLFTNTLCICMPPTLKLGNMGPDIRTFLISKQTVEMQTFLYCKASDNKGSRHIYHSQMDIFVELFIA